MMQPSTVFALSSGQGRAAIAVVRVSGVRVRFVIETILDRFPKARMASLVTVREPNGGMVIDRCLALFFPGPASATGEDVLELHVHGGTAVVRALLAVLGSLPELRPADAGEFTRRALENGKLDVLQVEALGDLLNADTSLQLAQAQRQLAGELGILASGWRGKLVEIRAGVEAELDFSDEGDVGPDVVIHARAQVGNLLSEMKYVLGQAERGARVREGAFVVIAGAPNAGKSMLMNALAARDVAIVSSHAGTTRDVLETVVDIGGWPVILSDTAGLRSSVDPVEIEGIERARTRVSGADVVLSVSAVDVEPIELASCNGKVIRVGTKSDVGSVADVDVQVSGLTGDGLDTLRSRIAEALSDGASSEPALLARARQRAALGDAVLALERAVDAQAAELVAEDLRAASFAIGRLVGQTDLETVLDHLFQGFCIGK